MLKLNTIFRHLKFPQLKNEFKYTQCFFRFSEFNISMNQEIRSSYEPITQRNIKDNKGARIVKTVLGRGPGSGKGKTSARGHKGYKARIGNVGRHFEGGSTPITRRLPKFGFRSPGLNYNYINIQKLAYYIHKGKIDATKPITMRELLWSGAVSKVKEGIKVLGRGNDCLKDLPPLHLEISQASQSVIDEIKKNGGSVKIVYKTPLTLRALTKPWRFIEPPMDPVPPFRKVVKLLKQEDKGVEYIFINKKGRIC